jgi:hypothetical protein
MIYEYDQEKSAKNKSKHGIDFVEAQQLWEDTGRLEIPAKKMSEPRSLVIGKIGNQYWSAIITYRQDNIRLISVRRAREEEKAYYENF